MGVRKQYPIICFVETSTTGGFEQLTTTLTDLHSFNLLAPFYASVVTGALAVV